MGYLMFDKYVRLWLYVLARLLGVALFPLFTEKGCGFYLTDWTFVAILSARCAGTERFLKVGNARFFLCLNDAGLWLVVLTGCPGRCSAGNGMDG